mgnify:CR=1 FL=1
MNKCSNIFPSEKSKEMQPKSQADAGDIDFMYEYATILYKGQSIPANLKEASRYFKKAADKGHEELMFEYASMLSNGLGVDQNYEESAGYYKICADNSCLYLHKL